MQISETKKNIKFVCCPFLTKFRKKFCYLKKMLTFAENTHIMLLVPATIKKPWKIPQNLTKESNRTRLIEMLASINNINDTTSYYIRDSYTQRIIVDSPTSTILCGHPMELTEFDGFAFYRRIFDKNEWERLNKLFMETYKIFYKYPPAKRRLLVSSYDFVAQTASGGDLVLRHRGAPYLLCDNGNLWLSLCSVTPSAEKRLGNAMVTHIGTGEQYVYMDERYVLSEQLALNQNDLLILKLICDDLADAQIISQLGICVRTFKRKKELLFSKLNVKNAGAAVYKAHLMGII